MASYTMYVLASQPPFYQDSGVAKITNSSGTQFTLGANEFPTKITIRGYIERVASVNANLTLYVSNTSRGNSYAIGTNWVQSESNGGTMLQHSSSWSTFAGSALKGASLALHIGGQAMCRRDSAAAWEVKITTVVHPTVSAGTVITKAQMDSLRSYRIAVGGSTPTAVSQGGVAYASHGNTYRSGLTAGSTVIDDAWYNGA